MISQASAHIITWAATDHVGAGIHRINGWVTGLITIAAFFMAIRAFLKDKPGKALVYALVGVLLIVIETNPAGVGQALLDQFNSLFNTNIQSG